ncbi:protein translocase subunit SecF [Gammaproteobacteria bacterium]|jgi:preprotein translocase subunit SecF|nr:protein translocase subunit SecF [Gammaproteobacteria bacterium]MBT6042668.1 protein translocase subunit SecF [Gammaproteobacteria bacterium]MDA9909509.1 protein translocase subunit SecF [Gammaproteobacteria bacterium]
MSEMKVINFMGLRKASMAFSGILLLISLGSFIVNGMHMGLDFTGGTQIQVSYSETPDLEEIRASISDAGYQNFEVMNFRTDDDVQIRIQETGSADADRVEAAQASDRIVELLQSRTTAEIETLGSGFIGSQVGEELREQGGLGMLVALIMIMIYISLRFQFKFSVGAVAALAHDVIITLGFFSLMQIDFDLTVLAALMAVIGYSLNDTIVVSDRIRENFRLLRKTDPVELINISITQTFSRTIITSLTTLLVLLALFLLGGEMIKGFSIALIVGVLIGTYSSVYVAANVLLMMHLTKEDLMPPVKEGEEADALP